jgi:hypothetical protein
MSMEISCVALLSWITWGLPSISALGLMGCAAHRENPNGPPIALPISTSNPIPVAPGSAESMSRFETSAPLEDVSKEDGGTPPSATLEHWIDGDVDDGDCVSYRDGSPARVVREPGTPKLLFSWDGYVAKSIRVERTIDDGARRHCVVVAWPKGDKNTDGKDVHVAAHVDDAWLRAIENTLSRVPWRHLSVLRRIVIDDRPTEHGIAPFDRRKRDDARDGHTIWLHERMFEEKNHWARGNFGSYWSYHANEDDVVIGDQKAEHALFSPVLLHELGHLVAYSIVNGQASNETVPKCAHTCGDDGGCKTLSDEEKERSCISPYCTPFRFETGTENWAEQYRFFYQSRVTRKALEDAESPCVETLAGKINDGRAAPWDDGMPDIEAFHKSLWKSCGEKPCKKM